MKSADPNMSLMPRTPMSAGERAGATLMGLGLLALLVAFAGARIQPYISLAFALGGLVAGGVLLLRKDVQHIRTVRILFAIGGVSLVLMALTSLQVFGVEDLESQGKSWLLWVLFALIFGGTSIGAILYYKNKFGTGPAGIRNNGTMTSEATRKQGAIAWILTILFTGFYVVLYWFPDNLAGLMAVVKPFQRVLAGHDGGTQWFLYTFIYTMLVLVMGIRFMYKYRHNKYQRVRTLSVTFFQLGFAFLLPYILSNLNNQQAQPWYQVVNRYSPQYEEYRKVRDDLYNVTRQLEDVNVQGRDSLEKVKASLEPQVKEKLAPLQPYQDSLRTLAPKVSEHYFTYFFPLKYDAFWPDNIERNLGSQAPDGVFEPWKTQAGFGSWGLLVMGVFAFMSFIGVVVLTYFFGKRWYCSWVCGCGGLAETAGDSFRHLSDKSLKAWRVERILIYSVLALIVVLTIVLLVDWKLHIFGNFAYSLKSAYGFLIGSVFAGVVGTGFYPILGSRGWCRFGCPQAAVLGILQKKFSRFRITTNGGQCISCGNCSTYCEMGIDVKAYAQRGQDIVRASCVGCGICSAVCPRGVLNLENGPMETRNLNPHTVSGLVHPGDM